MQARHTQSLSCPHVPWPASKHNDNLVQQALNRDGHLSHSRWWKHCAATAQTERRGLSCLTHIHWDSSHHFSSWLSFKMESDSSCDPNSLLILFSPPPFQSLSFDTHTDFLYCLRLTHGACWIGSRLEREGRGWVRIEVLSQLRQRMNKPCFLYPVLLLLLLLSYTCTHTHTCYQALSSSGGSGRQCNFLNTFPRSKCWIFYVFGILNRNR